MEKLQTRTLRFKDPHFRALENEGVKKIRGYPIIFNTPGYPYWNSEWSEIIDPAALNDIDLSELRMLVDHRTELLLGRTGINLRAEVDAIGLFIECVLPDTSLAKDTWTLVQSGILDGMSFSFYADVWQTDTDNKQDRIMHITDVLEVSLVTFPAYQAAVAIATETPSASPPQEGLKGDEEARSQAEAEAKLSFELSMIF